MKKKLKSKKAETLVETLVSILLCVISLLILAGALVASTRMNVEIQQEENVFMEELARAEVKQTPLAEKEVNFVFTLSEETVSVFIPVNIYGTASENLISYEKVESDTNE